MNVAVLGVGFCGSFPTSGGLSYREMIARAAAAAYSEAGIEAWELDGAVSCEEDFISGYSIADEYVPDQLGVQRKSVYTICGDFLQGVCSAAMQIETGRFQLLVVEAYSKASNLLTKSEVLHFAYDPVWNRFGVTPNYLAGIEMQRFLTLSPCSIGDVAEVVTRAKARGLANPAAPYAATLAPIDVLSSSPVATPVTQAMIARPADGAVVAVLGPSEMARRRSRKPVFLSGTGWASGTSVIEHRDHSISEGTLLSSRAAFKEAGVTDPQRDLDVVYVSDIFAHRALMHMEALEIETPMPINPDGGSLAMGDLMEANGGARFYDAVVQLRGEAGARQVPGAKRAAVHAWRGLPTDSCAMVVLESVGRAS